MNLLVLNMLKNGQKRFLTTSNMLLQTQTECLDKHLLHDCVADTNAIILTFILWLGNNNKLHSRLHLQLKWE